MFMRAVHPGQIILKDELKELGITPTEFSRQIEVPPNRVSQIIVGKRSITGEGRRPRCLSTGPLSRPAP